MRVQRSMDPHRHAHAVPPLIVTHTLWRSRRPAVVRALRAQRRVRLPGLLAVRAQQVEGTPAGSVHRTARPGLAWDQHHAAAAPHTRRNATLLSQEGLIQVRQQMLGAEPVSVYQLDEMQARSKETEGETGG